MKSLIGFTLVIYLCAIFVIALHLSHQPPPRTIPVLAIPEFLEIHYAAPPDFADIKDTRERKGAFFDYLGKIIDDENNRVLAHRNLLLEIQSSVDTEGLIEPEVIGALETYAEMFDVSSEENPKQLISTLLRRVDTIPKALALAQAASESAWGSSRFAIEGNNYFGQWCFSKGCGMVPKKRRDGAIHEVQVFASAADSVRSYINNINTHRAYRELRTLRAKAREQKERASALTLADGLVSYSERGSAYIEDIKTIIRTNRLESTEPEQLGAY